MPTWVSYNRGYVDQFVTYNRNGEPYSGTPEDFEKLHKNLSGFLNQFTNKLILVNYFGEIVAIGRVDEKYYQRKSR